MIQNSLKIFKNYVIWYIFRWAGGRVTRGGCVDGWVGGISLLVIEQALRPMPPPYFESFARRDSTSLKVRKA